MTQDEADRELMADLREIRLTDVLRRDDEQLRRAAERVIRAEDERYTAFGNAP